MKTARERFDEKVDRTPRHGPDGDCWLWTASKGMHGYGQFRYYDRLQRAHRVSYQIHKGEIPAGLFVLHSCDVRHCVNPDHLSLGTVQDNSDQMVERDRAATGDRHGSRTHPEKVARGEQLHPEKFRGERNGLAKLTEDDVREIRGWYFCSTGNCSQRSLARTYGVSQTAIGKIVRRETWTHVA